MFSFSKKQKTKEGVVAVFDIGSASVGGALVFLSEGKKPKILYNTRKQMAFHNSLSVKKFTLSMLRSLKEVNSELEKRGSTHLNFLKIEDKKIQEAFCFLSSPWSLSHTKIIKNNYNKPTIVSKELMESFIKKEEERFVNSDLDILDKNNGVELMDRKIMQFKLNGYRVNKPYKKKAKEVEAYLFLSVANKNILDQIEDIVQKNFHLDKLNMHSFTLAGFLSLRDIFNYEDDFVFIDVSGEVTDVSFIKDGVIKETQTFPLGRNSFIRNITDSFKCSYNLAVSMLKTYSSKEMDENTKVKLEDSLSKNEKSWGDSLERSLLDLSNGSILPKNIFILADDDISFLFKDIIQSKKFTKLVFPDYEKIANPVLINSHKIEELCDFGLDKDKDVFIGIESAFINRLFNTD